MAVLGSPSAIDLMVSVDVKQHLKKHGAFKTQELCESRGGRPGLPVPNSPMISVDVMQQLKKKHGASEFRSCVKAEVAV